MEPVRDAVSSVLKRRVVKQAEQRRAEILEAALHLFSSKGFHDTTMEEVAREAGVAKGTIYLYFQSKEHLLLALKRDFMQGLTDVVANIVADAIEQLEAGQKEIDYRDIIDDIFQGVVDYHTSRREEVEVVVRQSPSPDLVHEALELEREYLALVTSAFRTGMEFGLVHTEDPEMTAHLIIAAIRDNIATCLCYGEPSDIERLVEASKQMLYKALAPGVELPPRRPRLVKS
jgi:TetR/AcrR family fatty acid metabolism transcriptional regulator